jgi:hypothetical protein
LNHFATLPGDLFLFILSGLGGRGDGGLPPFLADNCDFISFFIKGIASCLLVLKGEAILLESVAIIDISFLEEE